MVARKVKCPPADVSGQKMRNNPKITEALAVANFWEIKVILSLSLKDLLK